MNLAALPTFTSCSSLIFCRRLRSASMSSFPKAVDGPTWGRYSSAALAMRSKVREDKTRSINPLRLDLDFTKKGVRVH
jgi:hypothetical protein